MDLLLPIDVCVNTISLPGPCFNYSVGPPELNITFPIVPTTTEVPPSPITTTFLPPPDTPTPSHQPEPITTPHSPLPTTTAILEPGPSVTTPWHTPTSPATDPHQLNIVLIAIVCAVSLFVVATIIMAVIIIYRYRRNSIPRSKSKKKLMKQKDEESCASNVDGKNGTVNPAYQEDEQHVMEEVKNGGHFKSTDPGGEVQEGETVIYYQADKRLVHQPHDGMGRAPPTVDKSEF